MYISLEKKEKETTSRKLKTMGEIRPPATELSQGYLRQELWPKEFIRISITFHSASKNDCSLIWIAPTLK